MRSQLKIGVALYSDGTPFCREDNVACEYRKTPFHFASASDLPGQTLWITNATLQDLISAGLHKNPKIAHEGFFRTRLVQMAQELGIRQLTLEQQAALLAEVLGNAAEMARLQLGLTQYPTKGIMQAVGQLYGPIEPAPDSVLLKIAEQACQRYTACERERRHQQAEIFSFWFPRFAWSQKLTSEPLPIDTEIKVIAQHRLPSMGSDAGQLVEWASENKIPLFARIKIHGLESTVGKLMNYGAGAQAVRARGNGSAYEARNMREWSPLPELELLSQYGDVEVVQVAMAVGWRRSGVSVYSSKVSPVSYAYGLVAENLWAGLTRKADHTGTVAKALSTAWLQAVDRMECLKAAEKLYGLGFEVLNYGNGRITVACPPSVRALIPQVAVELGLMYPASLDGLVPVQAQQGNPHHVMQHLLSKRDFGRIVQMDQAALKLLEASREA